jgi:quercetin dioxygenase-like cupin family protein
MIETIGTDDGVIAYIVRRDHDPGATAFVTPDEANLQVGFIACPPGRVIPRHYHLPMERSITGTNEVIIVRSGRCEVDLFDDRQQFVQSTTLETGDTIVLMRGGHGFRAMEGCMLMEVKQGPYYGQKEKSLF